MSPRPLRALLAAVVCVAAAAVPVLTTASPAAAATFRSAVLEQPATDTWSPWKACTAQQGSGSDNCAEVHAMAQLGNTIYVGGDFTELHFQGQTITGLGGFAAFDATTHQPITNVTLPRFKNTSGIAVRAIAIDPGNGDPATARIYVGGNFNYAAFGTEDYKITRQRLVSFTPDGALVAAYNPDQVVNALTISGGRLYVGGSLTTIRSNPPIDNTLVNVNRATVINLSTGAVDPTWAPTFAVTKATNPNDIGAIKTPAVTALTAGQGRIYIGGHFDSVGPTTGGGMEQHIMIVAVDPATGVVDSGFQAVTNPIDFDQHYWSIMSIVTVGNIGDANAGVLAAAGGLANRTYRFGPAGKNVWTFLSDGDDQALTVSGDDVYIGGHFQCTGPYPIPVQGSCTPPGPGDPVAGDAACVNADPASMPTCFYDKNDAVQDRTHLAMVSYSQTVKTTLKGGATYTTPRLLTDAGVEPWNPQLNPITSPYYYGVWTLNVFNGALWVGGVWKSINVPTGPDVPKDSTPDLQSYVKYDISKLAVFPAAAPLPTTTTTVTSSQNPSTVGDTVTFTATVAPTSGTGTPTGTVQFSIDGTDVGTAQTLAGGTATYATSGLTAGPHDVSATYSGDLSFSDSAGGVSGGQTVNPKPGPTGPLSLSIGDTTVLEGNSGTSNASFPVTLSGNPQSGKPVTVQVTTSNGTATAGSDYTAVSQTLTWNAGDPLTQNVNVPIIGDTNPEGAETFTVTLSSPTNAVLADATATGTINDEEGPIAFYVNDVSKLEGNSGTSPMTFTVTASPAPAPGQTVTVKVKSTQGTAKAGSDFKAVALHAISFTSATPTQQVSIPIIGDKTVEPNETVFLTLSAPSAGSVIGDGAGLGTIINDDGSLGATPPPAISVANTMVVEGTGGTSNAVFTLSLPSSPTQTTSVNVATADGTAIAGSDYTALPLTTITWAPGDPASRTVSVPITTDSIGEANETFTLNLSSPVNAVIGDASGLATIVDDDGGLPRISIGDAWTVEGNSGTHAMQFPVTLSQPLQAGQTVTVKYATAAGTATGPSDFIGLSGKVLTWLPGDPQTKMISVTIKGDTVVEPDETFKVNLSAVTGGALLQDGQALGTILNDD
jgi:hypothetical protein